MIEISFKIILWQMCSIFLLKIQKLFANLRKLLKLKNAFFFFYFRRLTWAIYLHDIPIKPITQLTFTCLKLTIETLEKGVKIV